MQLEPDILYTGIYKQCSCSYLITEIEFLSFKEDLGCPNCLRPKKYFKTVKIVSNKND